MKKNVSGDRFVSFAFGKYCLNNKHRERRIRCIFITYNIQLGNKMQKILQEKKYGIKLFLD